MLLLFTGCGNSKSIIIYSSMEEERNQDLSQKLKEKFPDKDVVVQHIGTGNSAAKIKNEGTNIEADIILDLETSHIDSLKDNFADVSIFDTSSFLDGVNTSNKYITWTKYSVGLIIDNKYFKKHKLDIPKTYEDLLKPQYKNLIAMPDPTSSGTGYAFYLNAVNIMGKDKAVEYFKKLKNNMREYTSSGSGPTNLLKQGEIAIAMGMYSQGAKDITDGYDFSIVELKTGSPYNTTSAGVIKGREENNDVKEVFQWLITDFCKYDKEVYLPAELFKEQKITIKNYPDKVTDADMKNIQDAKVKEDLAKEWEKVNG
jgi:iron(III) transport system substrate-binding protein